DLMAHVCEEPFLHLSGLFGFGFGEDELTLDVSFFRDVADKALESLRAVLPVEEEGGLFDPFLFAGAGETAEFEKRLTGCLADLAVIMIVDFLQLFRVDEKGKMLTDQLFGGISREGMDTGAGKFDLSADIGGIDNAGEVIDQFAVIGLGQNSLHNRDGPTRAGESIERERHVYKILRCVRDGKIRKLLIFP